MSLIREKKKAFEQERTTAKANKLKGLREERLRVEGQAKIDRLYDKEKERIKKAKKEKFERSTTGKLLKGLQTYQKKSQSRKGGKMPKAKGFDPEVNEAFSLGGSGKKKRFFYE